MAGSNVSLGFGLVNIPIKIYPILGDPTTKGKTHMVHSVCKTQLKSPRTCPKCQKEVSKEEIIKGFAWSKEELIPLTNADLEQLPLRSRRNLSITEFVPESEIHDVITLIDKFYLVEPADDKPNTVKAFALFNAVMGEKFEVGVSKISFSTEEHLCFIISGENFPQYAGQGVMILQLAPWPAQIKDLSNMGKVVPVSEKEKALAMALIGQLHSETLDLSKYSDTYEKAFLELVSRKRDGEDVSIPVPEAEPTEDTSLLDSLMASLAPASK